MLVRQSHYGHVSFVLSTDLEARFVTTRNDTRVQATNPLALQMLFASAESGSITSGYPTLCWSWQMLFFGSQCEKMCLLQFSLISLIPGLLRNLQDCSDPALDFFEGSIVPPTSLRTSDRNSRKHLTLIKIILVLTLNSVVIHGITATNFRKGTSAVEQRLVD